MDRRKFIGGSLVGSVAAVSSQSYSSTISASDGTSIETSDITQLSQHLQSGAILNGYDELKAIDTSTLSNGDLIQLSYRSFINDGAGGAFVWNDSDLSTDVLNDPGEGVFVPPASDSTGASGAFVFRNLHSRLSVRRFGAVLAGDNGDPDSDSSGTDSNDDTAAWNNALSYSGIYRIPIEFDSDSLCNCEVLEVPQYAAIYGIGSATLILKMGKIKPAGDNTFKNFKLDFRSTGEQLVASTVSNILIEGLDVTGSSKHAIWFNGNSSNITVRKTKSHDNAGRGMHFSSCTKIFLYENETYDNDGHGLALQNSEDFIVDGLLTFGNGSTNNSGLSWPGSSRGTISNVVSHSNDEHGISTTGGFDVVLSNFVCFGNGHGGINFQSDKYANPSHTITVTNGKCYQNDVGCYLKEFNENITFIGGHYNDNTTASIRFVDLNGSTLKSDKIRGVGVDLQTSTGGTLLNSNGSTRVNFPESLNFRRGAYYPSATETEAFTPVTEMNTRGVTHTFPETWEADDSGNIARATTQHLINGRVIRIVATNGSVTIQHDNGGLETPFFNRSGANLVLAQGQGASWVFNATLNALVEVGA